MDSTPGLTPKAREESSNLTRGLGLLDATMIVIGSMIGSGIFIVSAESSRLVGAPGWLLAAWAIAGLMTITGALCCALNAHHVPAAALITQGVWAAVLTLPRTVTVDSQTGAVIYGNVYTQLLEYIIPADLVLYALMGRSGVPCAVHLGYRLSAGADGNTFLPGLAQSGCVASAGGRCLW